MPYPLDALKLAALPRDRVLPIHEGSAPFTCALCGARQHAYAWRVTLPQRAGVACPSCAQDHGWSVQ